MQQKPAESLVESRVDHYQTPTEVRVSIFAKQADQTRSTIVLEEDKVRCSPYFFTLCSQDACVDHTRPILARWKEG